VNPLPPRGVLSLEPRREGQSMVSR
jgi:hypothetical protein